MSTASELDVTRLLGTDTVALRDVRCAGECRHRSVEECAATTHLVFPYRGVYLRHVGGDQAVADANHVLFFNAGEGYQVSHPIAGGDASLSLTLSEPLLRELAPASLLSRREAIGFRLQHLGIDPRTQALVSGPSRLPGRRQQPPEGRDTSGNIRITAGPKSKDQSGG